MLPDSTLQRDQIEVAINQYKDFLKILPVTRTAWAACTAMRIMALQKKTFLMATLLRKTL